MLVRLRSGLRIRSLPCSASGIQRYLISARHYSEQPPSDSPTPKVGPTENLKEWREMAMINGKAKLTAWTSAAEQQFTALGIKLNRLTGYELVEELKRQVVEQESRIEAARNTSRQAKVAYENAIAERSKCQRDVYDLLQRKSSWSDSDVVRFTDLVRHDRLNEQAEAKAKVEASQTDQAIEQEFQNLTRAILNRYHEEQVWSDKIRSASTYGSLVALGLNLAVFVLAVIVVEPYKRKKMAQTFERRIETLSSETRDMVESIASRIDNHLTRQEALLSPVITPSTEPEPLEPSDTVPTKTLSLPAENREILAAGFGAATAIAVCGVFLLVFRS